MEKPGSNITDSPAINSTSSPAGIVLSKQSFESA